MNKALLCFLLAIFFSGSAATLFVVAILESLK